MVLSVSYYTKLKLRGVYCLVWCAVCDFGYSPTLIHPDLQFSARNKITSRYPTDMKGLGYV